MSRIAPARPAPPAALPAPADPDAGALPARALPARALPARALPRLRLHHRFALVGSVVSFLGMLAVGNLVADSIEASVVRNSAISSAVYMESFIAPLSQELASSEALSADTIARLRALLDDPALAERVLSVKIWRPGGLVAFSTDAEIIGHRFPPGEELRAAWQGGLSASFEDLDDAENARERQAGVPLLEVYNPIHSIVTGKIIAVAEVYLNAAELQADLRAARLRSWATVAAVTAATFAALFGIVLAGSRTIDRQNRALTDQLAELARVSSQNESLRERVQAASRRVSETNERYMRRISAELHDGPAQALALASLRLDSLLRRASMGADDPEARDLRATLDEAMRDVRDLCRGLTLPELEGRDIAETLEMAIAAHERRTGVQVRRDLPGDGSLDRGAAHPILICIYRFIQEGLMNAFRHAPGAPVEVIGRLEGRRLTVAVADRGPGFDLARLCHSRLGLSGLRERVESIGGEFRLETGPDRGTRLDIVLAVAP